MVGSWKKSIMVLDFNDFSRIDYKIGILFWEVKFYKVGFRGYIGIE